jgi:hypothetical protein
MKKGKQCYKQFFFKTINLFVALLHLTISSFSNSPSNLSKSSFKSILFSKNSAKLDGDLHPTLGSLS